MAILFAGWRWSTRPVGRLPTDADAVAAVAPVLGWERWSRITDWLLLGPDAGAWAQAGLDARAGELLDAFRLPVYARLTAAVPVEDIALAGHLVNHAAASLTVGLTYLLGARLGGRPVGATAAVLLALNPQARAQAMLFGVDPTVQLVSALLFATTWAAMRRGGLWRTLAAGATAGVVLATHFLGLLIVAAALPLLALAPNRRWWARLAAPAAGLAVAAPVAAHLLRDQEVLPNLTLIMGVYGTGVLGESSAPNDQQALFARALSFVQDRLAGAVTPTVEHALAGVNLGGVWPPLLGIALWAGILSPGRRGDLRATAFLALGLAPLVLLTAAAAPERYAGYALPLVLVAMARACVAPGRWLGASVHPRGRAWGGALAAALTLGALVPSQLRWAPGPPSTVRVVQDFRAAQALVSATPSNAGSGGVITRSQTIPLLSDRTRCPQQRCTGAADDPLQDCLTRVLLECPGSGDIPYVHEQTEVFGPGDARSDSLLQFVQAHAEPAWTDTTDDRTVTVYWLSRAVIERETGPVRRGPQAPPPQRRWTLFSTDAPTHGSAPSGSPPPPPKPQFGVVPPSPQSPPPRSP